MCSKLWLCYWGRTSHFLEQCCTLEMWLRRRPKLLVKSFQMYYCWAQYARMKLKLPTNCTHHNSSQWIYCFKLWTNLLLALMLCMSQWRSLALSCERFQWLSSLLRPYIPLLIKRSSKRNPVCNPVIIIKGHLF